VNSSADVIFMLDNSWDVGVNNFTTQKLFLAAFVTKLDIDSGKTRVGLLSFTMSVGNTAVFNLNSHSTVAALQSAIQKVTYMGDYGANTALAFDYVRTRMLKSAAGDRANVQNIVVLITHSQSDNFGATVVSIEFIELFIAQYQLSVWL